MAARNITYEARVEAILARIDRISAEIATATLELNAEITKEKNQ
jgi:hypothetical protein